MRRLFFLFGTVLLLTAMASTLSADLRKRWSLDFSNQSPRMFTYRAPSGETRNYWYCVYTVKNTAGVDAPLRIDFAVKTDTGKYYTAGFHPEVEGQIIAAEARLDGLALGIQKDVIREMKEQGKFLNPSEMHERGTLSSGASIVGLAIFNEWDPNFDAFDLRVSGLRDPLRRHFPEPGEVDMNPSWVYENEMLVIQYEMPGDAYYKNLDTPEYITRGFIRKPIGPVASLETIGVLVAALRNEDPLLRTCSDTLLRRITPNHDGFGYSPTADVAANTPAILLWEEWWHRNRSRLVYDEPGYAWKLAEAGE